MVERANVYVSLDKRHEIRQASPLWDRARAISSIEPGSGPTMPQLAYCVGHVLDPSSVLAHDLRLRSRLTYPPLRARPRCHRDDRTLKEKSPLTGIQRVAERPKGVDLAAVPWRHSCRRFRVDHCRGVRHRV